MIQISQKINWHEILKTSNYLQMQILAGYYNRNYIISSGGTKYILRIPIHDAQSMDLRIIPESTVLKFLEQKSFLAPRLIYENNDNSFLIHKFIKGKLFNDLYPANIKFQDWIPINIANQMKNLHQLNPKSFQSYCKNIAKSPNSNGFFLYLIKVVEDIYEKFKKPYALHFKKLQFPKDPFKVVKINSLKLKPRQFTLCHCDIHRKNLIIAEKENRKDLVILDWELALVADPFYDVATHFHKMCYESSQELLFLEQYFGQNRETAFFKDSWAQIQIYLQLEKVKSAIVDLVRISERFKAEPLEEKRISLAEKYQNILRKAWVVWEKELTQFLSSSEIYSLLTQ